MFAWNNELYHNWGFSAKMKRLEHLYNKWYYQHNKEKWKDNDNDSKGERAAKRAQRNLNNAEAGERRPVERMSSKYADIIRTKPDSKTKSSSSYGGGGGSGSSNKNKSKSKGKSGSGKSGSGKKSSGKKSSKKAAKKEKSIKEKLNDSYEYVYQNGKLVKINKNKNNPAPPPAQKKTKKKSKKKKYKNIKTNKKSSISSKQLTNGMKVLNNVLKNRRK